MKRIFAALLLISIAHIPAAEAWSVSGWVPYRNAETGLPALAANLDRFQVISPFAYTVDKNGTLVDEWGISSSTAADVMNIASAARKKSIKIIPSILWGDKNAIHVMLSDSEKRGEHIRQIVSLVTTRGFDGIDIDYEAKNLEDREDFSKFIAELKAALMPLNGKLSCTVEARQSDFPASSTPEKMLFPWANDYSVLNKHCDQVRIMAYDDYYLTFGSHNFTTRIPVSKSVANAPLDFVNNVLIYAVSRIDRGKIVLGIPTYGYEFAVAIRGSVRTVARTRALVFETAREIARSAGAALRDTPRGEKFFLYEGRGGLRYVVFSDAETVKQRIAAAKQFGISGVSLFRIDGREDQAIWSVL